MTLCSFIHCSVCELESECAWVAEYVGWWLRLWVGVWVDW